MVVSVTRNDIVYLFDFLQVIHDERQRKLYLIHWSSGDFALIERIPSIDDWLSHESSISEEHLRDTVLLVTKQIINLTSLAETITLFDANLLIADFLKHQLRNEQNNIAQSA